MPQSPQLWRDPTPGARFVEDRIYTFGVAHDLERMRNGGFPDEAQFPPLPPGGRDHPLDHRIWRCWGEHRSRDIHGRYWTHVRHVWASSERRPSDVLHRMLCRFGRHQIRGGQQIQLGSSYVNIERRCRWCDMTA